MPDDKPLILGETGHGKDSHLSASCLLIKAAGLVVDAKPEDPEQSKGRGREGGE